MAKHEIEKTLAVSIEQAGRMLSISRNLAYQMATEGKIPTVKLGKRRLLVPVAALEKMLLTEEVNCI